MRLGSLVALIPLALGLPATAPARRELRVVPDLDLGRYAGRWFEIARLPNRFQSKCTGEVTAVYTPRPDGRLTVTNRCRRADGHIEEAVGVARRVNGRPASILEVRFAPAFLSFVPAVWGDYQIIALDPEYRHALVGTQDRRFLWVLSRTPRLDAEVLHALLAEAKAQGFDTDAVVRTPRAQS
jgi:apolipoprotein D and lipocalin family protein